MTKEENKTFNEAVTYIVMEVKKLKPANKKVPTMAEILIVIAKTPRSIKP